MTRVTKPNESSIHYHRSFSAKHGGGGGGSTPMTAARKRSAMLDAIRGRQSAAGMGSTSR